MSETNETVTVDLNKYLDYKAARERLAKIEQGEIVEYRTFRYHSDPFYTVVVPTDKFSEFTEKIESARILQLHEVIDKNKKTIKTLANNVVDLKADLKTREEELTAQKKLVYNLNQTKSFWQKLFGS